jgi:hypothetical protein
MVAGFTGEEADLNGQIITVLGDDADADADAAGADGADGAGADGADGAGDGAGGAGAAADGEEKGEGSGERGGAEGGDSGVGAEEVLVRVRVGGTDGQIRKVRRKSLAMLQNATDRITTDRIATDRIATDRIATDRIATASAIAAVGSAAPIAIGECEATRVFWLIAYPQHHLLHSFPSPTFRASTHIITVASTTHTHHMVSLSPFLTCINMHVEFFTSLTHLFTCT